MGRQQKRPGRRASPSADAQPRGKGRLSDGTGPRSLDPVRELKDRSPTWRTSDVDWAGSWGWSDVPAQTILAEIVTKLHEYETMLWADFRGQRNHDVEVNSLCPAARRRLEDLGKDDLDTLFSIRIDAKRRVWAERQLTCLHVLWWDPAHEVCPSHKKHT